MTALLRLLRPQRRDGWWRVAAGMALEHAAAQAMAERDHETRRETYEAIDELSSLVDEVDYSYGERSGV